MKKYLTLVILLSLLQMAFAQVDIKVNILPPYPSKITDYASRPQQVLIVLRSLSNLAQDIQLRGTITGDNGITLRVDPRYRSPSPIHLNGGQALNLNGTDISQLFDYNQLLFTGISKESVIRGNGLPEGNYQICLQAFNYTTNQPISSGQPLGCSNAFPITSVEPPVIISPFNDQPVSALTTQNFVISWTTPAGAPPSTQYTINMVEILDNRNPNDAIRSATSPPFFQQTVNAANLLLYGPSMPSLTPGRRYALLVTANDPFNTVTFRNNGRSEVTSFIYGDTTGATGSGNTTATGNGTNNGNIPAATVKGRLTWYYRQSEEMAPLTKTKFTPPSHTIPYAGKEQFIVNATLNDPSFVAGVKPTVQILKKNIPGNPTSNSNNSNNIRTAKESSDVSLIVLNSAAPTSPTAASTSKQVGGQLPYATNIQGGGWYSIYNANNPAFFSNYGRESHPMANTIIKLLATDTTQPGSTPQFAGAGLTDDQGNFQLSFIPPAAFGSGKGYRYSLSVQNNYFTLPDVTFSLPANSSSYDLGEIRALANTFRLLTFADDASDQEVPTAIVDIYRRADFYTANPALKTEGNNDENNRPVENIGGQPYIKVSSINDAYTGTRLFYSNGNADEYKVKVTAQNFSIYFTSLALSTVLTHPTSPQTIQQIYQLSTGPTTFTGTVNETTGGKTKQSVPGAIVTLYLTDSAYNSAMAARKQKILFAPKATGTIVSTLTADGSVIKPAPKSASAGSPAPIPAGSPKPPPGAAPMTATIRTPFSPVAPKSAPAPKSSNSREMQLNTPSGLVNDVVQLVHKGEMTATTDSSGAFVLSNIPINSAPMHYVVTVPGSGIDYTDTITLATKGSSTNRDVLFNFISYAVTGQVVDEKGDPLPNASLIWASGGTRIQVNANGYFATSNKAGTDTLIIRALGFQDRHMPVTIKGNLLAPTAPPASSGSGNSNSHTMAFIGSLQNTSTYKQAAAKGTPMTPQSFGFFATLNSNASASWTSSITQPHDQPSGAVDLGEIKLKKSTGRMLLTVLDAGSNPLNKASIRIVDTDSSESTGPDGTRYIEGPDGNIRLVISGPPGGSYAPQEVALAVNDQDTAKKTIYLLAGAKISGQVTAGGKPVAGADITVDGLDYLQTTSDNNGYYTLIVSKDTSYTFRAAKSGYVADHKAGSFKSDATLNFTLTTASFNITKLLGFPVQIDKIEDETATRKKLTGSFTNLPGNTLFSAKAGTTIPFTGIEVDITNNIPVPVNGAVTTDITELPLKAFNFLPVKLSNNGDALVISQTGSTGDAGLLQGLAAIDYTSFVPSGIAPYVDASLKQYIQSAASATPQPIVVLNSSGTLTATSLSLAGTGAQTFNLYGFTLTLDLANSSVKTDGLHLKGSISLNNIPLLNNTTLQVQDCWLGTNGYISGVKVNMDPAPSFNIAGWSGSLTGLSFNDNGFSVSGNLKVQVPGSAVSEVDFANLSIATDQLYGGSFTIPSAGIDVFGIVKFLGGPTPLSFGKLGSSNVYYIGGSGTVQFPSLFGNMTLQFFQIQTNGQFAATVPANINEDFFGVADVTITDIGFHTINGMGVDVQGNFLLKAIPWIKANVGGVHFGTGGSVSVDQLGLSFDMVGIAKVSANLTFVNQPDKKGFSGNGSITIAGLPGADISFSYYKVPNGISVSAFFRANVSIPIGAIVSINNPGGGFSLNTGDGSWSVTITGDASITGLGTAVSIANINVTVNNGPVIKGSASLEVLTINIANADLLVDIPKALLKIDINAAVNLIPKVVTAEGSACFVLSAAKNDTYFMIGAQYQSSLLGIFNDNANITAGWGLNVANHPEYAEYTSFIDPHYLDNGVLKGIDLQAQSDIGANLTGTLFSVVTGNIYYNNYAMVKLNMGIGAGNYGIYIGAGWSCGGSVSIDGHDIAAVNVSASGDVSGYYDNGSGNISLAADLAGHFDAHVGDCDDDCYTGLCGHICHDFWGVQLCAIPTGVKICLDASLHLSYDNQNGFGIALKL